MQYTLKQAEKALTQYSNAYGVTNVRDAINRAVRALSQMAGWQCLRKVLRFTSVGPCFTLPQGYTGLVRVCVNGSPSTVRGQDFSFVHSGPGDLTNPPGGFRPVDTRDLRDVGMHPTYILPASDCRLFAFTDTESGSESSDDSEGSSEPDLIVRGVNPDGVLVEASIPLSDVPISPSSIAAATVDPTVFSTITEVIVQDGTTGHVTLYAEDYMTESRYFLSLYHPVVSVPSFRHYLIPGVDEEQVVEILAEVRMDPLPLISDTDVLPIDALEPIEWMIMADWKLKSSEIDAAQKYQNLAAGWMKSKEVADNTVQAAVVVNNRLAGSMLEVSAGAWNI